MSISTHPKLPKYVLVDEYLRDCIKKGEMRPGDRLPTVAQLRKQFGVSNFTVSQVYFMLEQDGLVDRKQGNGVFVAGAPKSVKTGVIGFIGNEFTARQKFSYFAQIADGVQSEAEKQGQRILLLGNSASWNEEDGDKIDGVLLCDVEEPEPILQRLPQGLPRVAMMVEAQDIPSIVADDYNGAKSAVHHLVELGHQRIACLIGKGLSLPELRTAGYLDALKENNITPHKRWRRHPQLQRPPGIHFVDWGREQMQTWLDEDWHQIGCTALLVQNDLAAIGAMQAIQSAGLRVPEDVSVVGFDGTELCEYIVPQLSSVEVPLYEIGSQAVKVLLHHLAEPPGKAETLVLPTRFQARESSASPCELPGRRLPKKSPVKATTRSNSVLEVS